MIHEMNKQPKRLACLISLMDRASRPVITKIRVRFLVKPEFFQFFFFQPFRLFIELRGSFLLSYLYPPLKIWVIHRLPFKKTSGGKKKATLRRPKWSDLITGGTTATKHIFVDSPPPHPHRSLLHLENKFEERKRGWEEARRVILALAGLCGEVRVILTKIFSHLILSSKCIFLRSTQAHLGIAVV